MRGTTFINATATNDPMHANKNYGHGYWNTEFCRTQNSLYWRLHMPAACITLYNNWKPIDI